MDSGLTCLPGRLTGRDVIDAIVLLGFVTLVWLAAFVAIVRLFVWWGRKR